MSNDIFVISAPAGTGKSTIAAMLTKSLPFLHRAITTTTRSPRENEKEGVDYYFVSLDTFAKMEQEGEFIESVAQYGFRYGTTKKAVLDPLQEGKSVLLVIDTEGAKNVLALWPQAVLIFIKPPSLEELEKRLVGRKSESSASLAKRMLKANQELNDEKYFHYTVVNDRLEDAYEAVKRIITKIRNDHVTKR